MTLDVPVFDRKNVKRYFYYFLAFNIIISLASVLTVGLLGARKNPQFFNSTNSWILIGVYFLVTSWFNRRSKKQLVAIQQTQDYVLKFTQYENYYRKKLLFSSSAVLLTIALWVSDKSNFFLYFLGFQLI